MAERTTSKSRDFEVEYWEANWDGVKLPVQHTPSKNRELHRIFARHVPPAPASLFEIGCAPGGWMAYFAKHFGYAVGGLEYAPRAHEMTLENLRMLDVPAEVHLADFLTFETSPSDVVFSYGFVEHFPDLGAIVERVVTFARPSGGLVITCVPALSGLNWWISRTFRPTVAAGHYPVTLAGLTAVHEAAGLRTVCARLCGAYQVVPPMDRNAFADEHPTTTRLLNAPFRILAKGARALENGLRFYPQCESVHTHMVYIGVRA